jgi:SAM-dependent methyltransferase
LSESRPALEARRHPGALRDLGRRVYEGLRRSASWARLGGGQDYVYDPGSGLHGTWRPEHRWEGLAPLLLRSRGLTLLDLGCAEGHVIEQFLHAGVARARGFDSQPRRIRSARLRVRDPRAAFQVADFGSWPRFLASQPLEPAYDIVLLLTVYQELPPTARDQALRGMLGLCQGFFALRLPRSLIEPPTRTIEDEGFDGLYEYGSPIAGDCLRVFRRPSAG